MVRIGTGPPFWQINHANSAYFRLFLGYFGVISATRPPLLDLSPPPFYISWIRPWINSVFDIFTHVYRKFQMNFKQRKHSFTPHCGFLQNFSGKKLEEIVSSSWKKWKTPQVSEERCFFSLLTSTVSEGSALKTSIHSLVSNGAPITYNWCMNINLRANSGEESLVSQEWISFSYKALSKHTKSTFSRWVFISIIMSFVFFLGLSTYICKHGQKHTIFSQFCMFCTPIRCIIWF